MSRFAEIDAQQGHWVFSFGSNSIAQLRGRIQNPNLVAFPAKVRDWERIFCMKSTIWGPGGVASLTESAGSCVYGAAVHLSLEELQRLDNFECPAYSRIELNCEIITDKESAAGSFHTAFAYINNKPQWHGPPPIPYLTAIQLMLREQWAELCPEALAIKVFGMVPVKECSSLCLVHFQTWTHPGIPSLPLNALVVEANARRHPDKLWVMPRTMNEITDKLRRVGVVSSAQLMVYLMDAEKMDLLNSRLASVGAKRFALETLKAFAELLEVPSLSSNNE